MKVLVMVFILQFCLGLFDVTSDMVNGVNFIDGEYGLSIYFIAGVASEYAGQYGPHILNGVLTLAVIYVPGAFRTIQMAQDTKFSEMSPWERALTVPFLITITVAWPVLIPFL